MWRVVMGVVLFCVMERVHSGEAALWMLFCVGHGDCVKLVKSYGVPLLVLGGGGENLVCEQAPPNAASRCRIQSATCRGAGRTRLPCCSTTKSATVTRLLVFWATDA